jgi:hypothetical protein
MKDLTLYGIKRYLIEMPDKAAVIRTSRKEKKFIRMYAQFGKEALCDPENDSSVRNGGVVNLYIMLHSGRDNQHVSALHPVRGIRIKHGYFPFQKKIKLIIAVRMLFHIAEIQVFVIVDLEIPGNHILTVQECSRQIIYHDFSCADKPVCFRKKT